MKKYLILILLLIRAVTGFSQTPWQATTSFPKQDPGAGTTLAVAPNTNYFFVSVEEEGLLRSTNAGDSWERILTLPVYTVAVRQDGTVFAGGIGVMHISSDQGQTWSQYPIATSDSPVSKIVFNSKGHVFLGTSDYIEASNPDLTGDGVFTSTDNGQTWQQLNNGISGLLAVDALVIDSQDRLYIGISDEISDAGGGIYTLAPGTASWVYLPIAFKGITDVKVKYVHSMAVDQQNHLYATIEGSYGTMGVLRTLKSEDGGFTWKIFAIGESLSGDYYDDFAFYNIYASKSGNIWVCMSLRIGIAYTANDGASWTAHTSGIGPTNTLFIFAEAANGQLLTLRKYDGNIVYKASIPLQVEEPSSARNISLNTYPNPFNHELKISYSLPLPQEAMLIITDAIGNIKMTQSVRATPESQTLLWQPSNLPAGIYFVKLRATLQNVVQKVVLTR